jgi:hypothetical protein
MNNKRKMKKKKKKTDNAISHAGSKLFSTQNSISSGEFRNFT